MTGAVIPLPTERRLLEHELHYILDAARWAPSKDNSQPWRVLPVAGGLWVCIDRDAPQPFGGSGDLAAQLSLGAFAENARLAASEIGIGCDVEPVAGEPRNPIVRLLWHHRVVQDPLSRYIRARVTNRKPHWAGSFGPDDEALLLGSLSDRQKPQVTFVWSTGALQHAADAVALAEQVRFGHRVCVAEVQQSLWWPDEPSRSSTGFHPATLELTGAERAVLRVLGRMPLASAGAGLSRLSWLAARRVRRRVASSGAIGMIALEGPSGGDAVRAGMTLQRIWLAATAMGFSFHSLGTLPLFIQRVHRRLGGFDERQLATLARARRTLSRIVGAPSPERLGIMFRVGRAEAPSARTSRLGVHRILD